MADDSKLDELLDAVTAQTASVEELTQEVGNKTQEINEKVKEATDYLEYSRANAVSELDRRTNEAIVELENSVEDAVSESIDTEIQSALQTVPGTARTEAQTVLGTHDSSASVHTALRAAIIAEVASTVGDAAAAAQNSADAALLNSGMYDTPALGVAGVTEGNFFSVPSPLEDESFVLYQHTAGETATVVKRYPSIELVRGTNRRTQTLEHLTAGMKRLPLNSLGLTHAYLSSTNQVIFGIKDNGDLVGNFPIEVEAFDDGWVQLPLNTQGIIRAIVDKSNRILFGLKDDGTLISSHEHEYHNTNGLLVSAVVDGNGESQVFSFDQTNYTKVSKDGADWLAPVVHSKNIIRTLTDYYSPGKMNGVTITPDGEYIMEGGVVRHQVVVGQSLALGSRGYILDPNGLYNFANDDYGNLYTPVCPEDLVDHCLTLNNGIRQAGTELVPTHELPDGVLGETVCSSYMISRARYIREIIGDLLTRFVSTVTGVGGVSYDSLRKGSSVYTNTLTRVQSVVDAAQAKGWGYVCSTVRIIHGESQHLASDDADKTVAGYTSILREWVSDYQADIMAISGQREAPVGIVCQTNTAQGGSKAVPLAQLLAHESYDDITLIGPKYQHPYYDSAHMLAEGYVKTGELEARAMRFIDRDLQWDCLRPLSHSWSGNVLTINFNNVVDGDSTTPGPIGELTIDTTTITDPGKYGFECSDELVTILSIAVGTDKTSLVLTFDSLPAAGSLLNYAYQTTSMPANGPRGNIRDSDTRDISMFDNNPIYNWLVTFSRTII